MSSILNNINRLQQAHHQDATTLLQKINDELQSHHESNNGFSPSSLGSNNVLVNEVLSLLRRLKASNSATDEELLVTIDILGKFSMFPDVREKLNGFKMSLTHKSEPVVQNEPQINDTKIKESAINGNPRFNYKRISIIAFAITLITAIIAVTYSYIFKKTDKTFLTTYYHDSDSDGYGNPNMTYEAKNQPFGYVNNSDDPDDSDPCIPIECEEETIVIIDDEEEDENIVVIIDDDIVEPELTETNNSPTLNFKYMVSSFVQAEDDRNINSVLDYYHFPLIRYYNKYNVQRTDLEADYNGAWNRSIESRNEIIEIKEIEYGKEYYYTTDFIRKPSHDEEEIKTRSKVIIKFSDGKIVEIYNVK